MKLIIENIGMLEHAEISLRKLCVIAGENDNGKSTIGKIFFCIVKAINRYREDLQESKEFWVNEKTDEIYFRLREAIRFTGPEVMDVLRRLRMSSRHRLNAEEQLAAVDESIQRVFALTEFEPSARQEVLALRDEIQAVLDQPENINQSIENALNKVFASEFDASLLLHGATQGRILLVENDLTLMDLAVTDEGVRLMGEVEPVALKDATFIDSPLIMNNHDVLARSQTLLDVDQRRSGRLSLPYTTLHTKDLFDKLRTPALPLDLFSPDNTMRTDRVLGDLDALIDGEVTYDKTERDFVFRRSSGAAISIKNTASGIKVFGLLKMLVANEFVTKDTILIFDEPENHLHPKWQLKLAQVLLKLVESGVYVLVSSHSPYLIEALKRGVDRVGLTNEARFALAQERKINDEDRLSDIFSVLAEPFEAFRQMDAEDLADE
ncbi:AAA family ATPase [Pseudomonas helleri]|uniref:AAA family ATPase n=1 Tax=Pseudomonas helleri TaxID=1608996 RepID=A0A7X2C4R2_9PSED|nr:AAA family ATPase [Pseudomonas helleri]MQT90768.1 AAA family ATPase [Pseudomonas helleri]